MSCDTSDAKKMFAMSDSEMLLIAIYKHQKEFSGDFPKSIQMPPSVFYELRCELDFNRHFQIIGNGHLNEFYGVPIIIDATATRLKLINKNN